MPVQAPAEESTPVSGPSFQAGVSLAAAPRREAEGLPEGFRAFQAAEEARLRGRYADAVRLYATLISGPNALASGGRGDAQAKGGLAAGMAGGARLRAQAQLRIAEVQFENLKDYAAARLAYDACLRPPVQEHLTPEEQQSVRARLEELDRLKGASR